MRVTHEMSDAVPKPLEEVQGIGPMCECGHRRGLHIGGKWACDFYLERLNVCRCIRFVAATTDPEVPA